MSVREDPESVPAYEKVENGEQNVVVKSVHIEILL